MARLPHVAVLLLLFIVPSGIYIASRLRAASAASATPAISGPRSRKQEAIDRDKKTEVVWTPVFTGLVISVGVALALLIVTMIAISSGQYNPYTVRAASPMRIRAARQTSSVTSLVAGARPEQRRVGPRHRLRVPQADAAPPPGQAGRQRAAL